MNNVAQGAAVLTVLFLTKTKIKIFMHRFGNFSAPWNYRTSYVWCDFETEISILRCDHRFSSWFSLDRGNKTLALAMGAAGLPGIISIAPQSWLNFAIGLGISILTSAIMTVILMKNSRKKN